MEQDEFLSVGSALGCANLIAEAQKKVGRIDWSLAPSTKSFAMENQSARKLLSLSKELGFYDSDWSLHFYKGGPKISEDYGPSLYHAGGWRMPSLVLSVLFRDLTS